MDLKEAKAIVDSREKLPADRWQEAVQIVIEADAGSDKEE